MSMDVVAFWNDVPGEMDYKSGQSVGNPEEHWQRRLCATALMFFYDSPTAFSRVVYIWDDGSLHPDGCDFTCIDADGFCDEMVETIDAVWDARDLFAGGVMPDVYPDDDTCSYCPAQMSCPYWTNFAMAMAGRLQAIESGPTVEAMAPTELARVWEDSKQAETIAEHTLKGLKVIAAKQPIAIGDTHVVEGRERSRTYFDDAKARGLIIILAARAGMSDEETNAALAELNGKTAYTEFRKVKLPVVKEKKPRKKKAATSEDAAAE
jgi:hypothetical protein